MTYLKEINGYILNNRSQNDNEYLKIISRLNWRRAIFNKHAQKVDTHGLTPVALKI